MRRIWPIFFFICSGIDISVLAQDTLMLPQVTVSVTPFQQRIEKTSGSISILLKESGADDYDFNISEGLNYLPGIFAAIGTNTTNRLTIRGIGSRTPYGTNRIRVYLNEIPMNNGDGVSIIEDVDVSGISRMEILKGPVSAIYGAGLGGMVMLHPLRPVENGLVLNVMAGGGSFNEVRSSAGGSWKNDRSFIDFRVSTAGSSGFRQNSNYRRNQVILNSYSEGENSGLSFLFLLTSLYAGIPSSLSLDDYREDPSDAAPAWLAVKGFEEYAKISGGISWKLMRWKNIENNLTLFGSITDPYESRPFNILDDRSLISGIRNSLKFEYKDFKLKAGFEVFHESYTWKIYETSGGTPVGLVTENKENRFYSNLFSHILWEGPERLLLEGGINLNLLKYDIRSFFSADGEDVTGEYRYKPVFSPRLGLNYRIGNLHYIHFSAGHGFSAPSLEESLLPEGSYNANLLPESGWNIESGIRGWLLNKRWFYDLSIYRIFVKNMLVTKRISEEVFMGVNAGLANFSGIELYNDISLIDQDKKGTIQSDLRLSVFISSNRFKKFVDDGADFSGRYLPGIPEQMISIISRNSFRNHLWFSPSLRYQGKQYLNDANSGSYKGYFLIDISFDYRLSLKSGFSDAIFFGGVKNLFDRKYASMILVNAPSFGDSQPRYYYPGTPRSFFAGVKFNIKTRKDPRNQGPF